MTRVIIRAVPTRLKCVSYLLRHLPDAETVMDPNFRRADLDGRQKSMATFAAALRVAGESSCLHLEDDIVLCRDFRAKVEAEISARPGQVIQFFSMRSADLTTGSRLDRNFMMTQCFYLPPSYSNAIADSIPDWLERNPKDPGGIDMVIRDWLRARREPYWIHCPSLVDHEVGVSIADRRRSSKRQSKTFKDPLL